MDKRERESKERGAKCRKEHALRLTRYMKVPPHSPFKITIFRHNVFKLRWSDFRVVKELSGGSGIMANGYSSLSR